jgi:hypothetical protein
MKNIGKKQRLKNQKGQVVLKQLAEALRHHHFHHYRQTFGLCRKLEEEVIH